MLYYMIECVNLKAASVKPQLRDARRTYRRVNDVLREQVPAPTSIYVLPRLLSFTDGIETPDPNPKRLANWCLQHSLLHITFLEVGYLGL